jgi:hypothetical protein
MSDPKHDAHDHEFDADWPFADDPCAVALSTVAVLEEEHPVLVVSHDADDGMWQLLCGTTDDPDDGRLTCLGCLVAEDPTLMELADLPRGWEAWRESVDKPWQRERTTAHDEHDEH